LKDREATTSNSEMWWQTSWSWSTKKSKKSKCLPRKWSLWSLKIFKIKVSTNTSLMTKVIVMIALKKQKKSP